jgi:hypothetical protein
MHNRLHERRREPRLERRRLLARDEDLRHAMEPRERDDAACRIANSRSATSVDSLKKFCSAARALG